MSDAGAAALLASGDARARHQAQDSVVVPVIIIVVIVDAEPEETEEGQRIGPVHGPVPVEVGARLLGLDGGPEERATSRISSLWSSLTSAAEQSGTSK